MDTFRDVHYNEEDTLMPAAAPRSLAEIGEWTSIHCDYDEPNAIADAIREGCFDETHLSLAYVKPDEMHLMFTDGHLNDRYLGLKVEEIPVIGVGNVDLEVAPVNVSPNLPISVRDARDRVSRLSCKFADPLATLRYAGTFPDAQRHRLLTTIYEAGGHLWILKLFADFSKRCLSVFSCEPSEDLTEGNYFLLVRK